MDGKAKVVYRGRRFSVVCQNVRRPGVGFVEREWLHHAGSVTIVPLLVGGEVCLIRNSRVGVGRTLIELPAGTLESGESPEQTARRELAEETGYRANQLERIGSFFMSPGILDERMHLFLATGLVAGEAAREPGEQIENLVVAWSDALAMADGGEIEDAKTLVGLYACDRLLARRRST